MADTNIDDYDSQNKVKARAEAKEKERTELENDFNTNENIDKTIISESKLISEKDKESIFSRLITEYGKDKELFDMTYTLEKVILDESLSLSVGPQKPKDGESFSDFKNRVIEFKEKLYTELLEKNEINKGNKEIPESSEEIVEETTGTVKNILESQYIREQNNNGGIEGVKKTIQSNLDLDDKKINEKLNNTEEREKNKNNAKNIFFTEEKISKYSKENESLKDLGKLIIEGDKIIDEDLDNILGNFVIETGEDNLEDYARDNSETVNEALNLAFELQIEKLKDGKVNYRTETVENLKNEILEDTITNPLEKLEKFKELKSEVNTNIGSIAKKREKATTGKEKKLELQNKLKKLKIEYIELNKNPEQNKDKIEQIKKEAIEIQKQIKKETKEKKSPIEITGKNFDINSNSNEKAPENN